MNGGTAVKKRLNFRFHNPNPMGASTECILKELVAANMPKAEWDRQGIKDEEKHLKTGCPPFKLIFELRLSPPSPA